MAKQYKRTDGISEDERGEKFNLREAVESYTKRYGNSSDMPPRQEYLDRFRDRDGYIPEVVFFVLKAKKEGLEIDYKSSKVKMFERAMNKFSQVVHIINYSYQVFFQTQDHLTEDRETRFKNLDPDDERYKFKIKTDKWSSLARRNLEAAFASLFPKEIILDALNDLNSSYLKDMENFYEKRKFDSMWK